VNLPQLPDEDKITEKHILKSFDFSAEMMNECHQKLWWRYRPDQFFRFFAVRELIRDLQSDLGVEPQHTTVQLHEMVDGQREIYTLIHRNAMYVNVGLQDNWAMGHEVDKNKLEKFKSLEVALKTLHRYRMKAQEKGNLPIELGLRSLMKFFLNLPGNPSIWLLPDSSKLLAASVIWKETDDRDSVTLTIFDPVHPSFQ
jgi:hypothetical protein